MKYKLVIKTMIIAILIMIILVMTTGCNYRVIDLDYTYDKAICKIGNEVKEIEIKKWTDYDGEQLQIKSKDGKTYLVSSFNCTLVKE